MNRMKICLALLLLACLLAACDSGQAVVADGSVPSTRLSGIDIDGLRLEMDLEDAKLSGYTPTDRYAEQSNAFNFEQLRLFTDEAGRIEKIQAILSELNISIHGTEAVESVQAVSELLGSHYHEYWFDREQGLKAHTYYDREADYSATFVYIDDDTGRLVWLILE